MTMPSAPELAAADPKGLIRESYAIDGITLGECRSILIDWALSLPLGADTGAAIDVLMARYGQAIENHPMSQLLQEARAVPAKPRRRGGRAGRS
ncbi:MAG: hypothetical protein U5N55_09545 [Cypionkella sp.]|nr:hypothetical protein [Cypionkella sp.]